METPEHFTEETIRSLNSLIMYRLRSGESRVAVRSSLIAEGLSAEFADGLLAGIPEPFHWSISSTVAMTLSVAAFAVLPLAGAIIGAWAIWSPPVRAACGLWVIPALFLAAFSGLIGMAVGVGLAFALASVLSRLSVRGE